MKYIWDFFYGIIVIGSAPWGALLLMGSINEILSILIKKPDQDNLTLAMALIGPIVIISAFILALVYRWRKRVLPKLYIIYEIILGIAWSVALFFFYGVVVYSAIG